MSETDVKATIAELARWVRGNKGGSAPLNKRTAMHLLVYIELLEQSTERMRAEHADTWEHLRAK